MMKTTPEDKLRQHLERKRAEERALVESICQQLHPLSVESQEHVLAGIMVCLGFSRIEAAGPMPGVERWRR